MLRFDPHALRPPDEPWQYVVHGKVRWAPPRSTHLLARDYGPIWIRPDPKQDHWRNEHVLLAESRGEPLILWLCAVLYLDPPVQGNNVCPFSGTVREPLTQAVVHLTDASALRAHGLYDQALAKVDKVVRWYCQAMARRDAGDR